MHRQRYPGNVALREYVATRRAEYVSGTKAEKHRVAAEVVAWARDGNASEGRTGGRFLRLLTDPERSNVDPALLRQLTSMADGAANATSSKDGREKEAEELWTLAEEAAVMEKAKQLLRQMPSVKKRTERMLQRVSAAAASASGPIATGATASGAASGGAGGASGVGLVTSVPSVPTMSLSQGANQYTNNGPTNTAEEANGVVEEEEDFDLDFDLEAMADAVGVGGGGGGGGAAALPAAGTTAKLQALYDASPEALEPLPIQSSSTAGTSTGTTAATAGASSIAPDPSSLAEVDDRTQSILAQLRQQEQIDAAVSTEIVAEMHREAAGIVLGGGAGGGAGGGGSTGDEKKEETLLKDVHAHGAFNSDDGGACTAQAVVDLAEVVSSHNASGRTEEEEQKRAALLRTMRVVLDAAKSLDNKLGGEAARSRTDIDVEELTKKEMRTVGQFLFQHFTGVTCSGPSHHSEVSNDDDDTTADEQGRLKRRGPGRTLSQHEESSQQLRDAGLPTSVCILIQGLLDVTAEGNANDDDRFTSTKDLLEEVGRMVCSPDRYLFDPPPEQLTGTIQLPRGKLYGRDEQIAQLTSLIDALPQPEQRTHVVWLSGHSGTGKSSLVEASLLSSQQMQNGRVILCKFDPQAGPGQCLPAIFGAFNDYCRELVLDGGDLLDHVRRKILLALGANVVVLMDLIPDLRTLMGDSVVQAASGALQGATREALERFVHCFRVFVRTISSPSHPIIMFVDDVQWADASGLELLSSLIHDFDMRSMLFVGAYRDDAIGDEHPLRATIDGITSAGISTTPIHLGDLETGSINSFVADTLHLSPRLTRDLSSIIQSKTSGNPLFAAECLVDLSDQGLLQFSPTARRWTWNVMDIQAHGIAENALSLVAGKISRLPEDLQWILRVASCLGSRFQKSTINIVLPFASEGLSSTEGSLQRLQEEGLIVDMGQHLSFAHDSIHESAYGLIDPSERDAFHLAVGRMLWQAMINSNEGKNSETLFDAVAQLNRGIDLVPDKDEKLVIAEGNLLAGEKVVALGSFLQASLYLEQGASLVEEDDWQTNYELCLKLFTIGSECMYVVGNNEIAISMAQQALLHCRNFYDKLPAYAALIQSLGAATKLQQAIDCGLEVLRQVEEDFPTAIARQDTMQAFGKTKSMLEQRDASSIVGGPANETKSKGTAMSILMMLTRYAFVVNPGLMGMIICRMVQISLQFGVCAESSFAFAAFASTYGQAIKSASEHGFRIDQAVACERAAASFCRQGSIGFAKPFLQQAQSIYNDLGAKRKVKHIGGKLAALASSNIL